MVKIKAIILAAGYATRLYPLTLDTPKPLLNVGGRPMIEHIIDKIEKVDAVDVIYVVTNDKFADHFERWLETFDSRKDIKIINDGTKSNDDRLGAVGDIHHVFSTEGIEDDTMVIAGDNLFEFSLANMHDFFTKKKGTVVAFRDLKDKGLIANRLGTALLNDEHKIVEFQEKPPEPKSTLAATACYLFTKHDMKELERCIRENRKPDNSGDFVRYLSEKKDVFGYVFDERWYDIGSHDQLKEADIEWGKNAKN